MNCSCIPCNAFIKADTPQMTVKNTRAAEIPRDVWRLIFNYLNLGDQIACSTTCRTWRHIVSKSLIQHPYYNIGTFTCFKKFYSDLLKSRHVVLLDTTGSMKTDRDRISNGSQILRKLMNYIEPAIKARGFFIGNWGMKITLTHVKKESDAISFFNNMNVDGGISDFGLVSEKLFAKLKTLDTKLSTQVHVISDMRLQNGKSILLNSLSQKVTFHFFSVTSDPTPSFLSNIIENYKVNVDQPEPENKKRKTTKKVEVAIHPLAKAPQVPPPEKPIRNRGGIVGIKKPHRFRPSNPVHFNIPPKL